MNRNPPNLPHFARYLIPPVDWSPRQSLLICGGRDLPLPDLFSVFMRCFLWRGHPSWSFRHPLEIMAIDHASLVNHT